MIYIAELKQQFSQIILLNFVFDILKMWNY